jgi:hypothetical protein
VCVPEWIEDVKSSYIQDPDSDKLLRKIAKDVSTPPQFSIKDGIIKHGSKIYVGAATNLRLQLLGTFHQSALGGHSGIKATYQQIKKIFCWPQLKQMVHKFVTECPVCQLVKVPHTSPAGLLQPLDIPGTPWSSISLDFIEALPKSNGKEVILVVVDRLMKYAHFIALSHPYSVEQIIQVIMDNILRLHGCPLEIVSDRDRIFTSTMYQHIFQALQVKLKFSLSPAERWANGESKPVPRGIFKEHGIPGAKTVDKMVGYCRVVVQYFIPCFDQNDAIRSFISLLPAYGW